MKHHFFKTIVFLILGNISLVNFTTLSASWNPEDYFVEKILKNLNDQDYLNLKLKVIRYLEKSWCSQEKAELLMDLVFLTRPSICVEIGAFSGSSVLPIASVLKHLNSGTIYAIDAWSNSEAVKYLDKTDPNWKWWNEVDLKRVRKEFKKMRKTWNLNKYCTIIQKNTQEACKSLEKIDLLHIDGNFSDIGSMQDVVNYFPKVEKNGFILLSNVFITVNGKQLKKRAFKALYDTCNIVCEIDYGNTVLFQKK